MNSSLQFNCARCKKPVLQSQSKDIQRLLCDECLRPFQIWRKRESKQSPFEKCIACGSTEMSLPVLGTFDPYGCFCRDCYAFYADFVENWLDVYAEDLERSDTQ
jgi:hypothetical protein